MRLSREQKKLYDLMNKTHRNFFVTGKAGTGKSVLLRYFVDHTEKDVAVVAPTGVAAINVGGQTIHSFFRMDNSLQDVDDKGSTKDLPRGQKQIIASLDTLVIDEISMVSADVIDMIDSKMRHARGDGRPFGGCQVIVFGDLYQLPPVIKDDQSTRDFYNERYSSTFFFGIEKKKDFPFEVVELQHIFRQSDPAFTNILNKIRLGRSDSATLNDINTCFLQPPDDDRIITITGDNRTADYINKRRLRSLPGKERVYEGTSFGNFRRQNSTAEPYLRLKVGAQVMMLKNDYAGEMEQPRWVNGTLGTVSRLTGDSIHVNIDGCSYEIKQAEWEEREYFFDVKTNTLDSRVVATFTQYPVKLAYAITIHKSQGQTYDAVKIDLSRGAFATGQTYVALSRCRSIENLYLVSPLKASDIKVNQEVVDFMQRHAKTIDTFPERPRQISIARYRSPLGDMLLSANEFGITGIWFLGQKHFAQNLGPEFLRQFRRYEQLFTTNLRDFREQFSCRIGGAEVVLADNRPIKLARQWLYAYFSGNLRPGFRVPLRPQGTEFQLQVWRELYLIPPGKTSTYGTIAKKLKTSPRAVANAVARNPLALIIPCHRILGADGELIGYAAGIKRKAALLEHEHAEYKLSEDKTNKDNPAEDKSAKIPKSHKTSNPKKSKGAPKSHKSSTARHK